MEDLLLVAGVLCVVELCCACWLSGFSSGGRFVLKKQANAFHKFPEETLPHK